MGKCIPFLLKTSVLELQTKKNLPNPNPLIRVDVHFIAFFNVEGFVKLGYIAKGAVYAQKCGGVHIGYYLVGQGFVALMAQPA